MCFQQHKKVSVSSTLIELVVDGTVAIIDGLVVGASVVV